MSYEFYKVLHLLALFVLFTSLGGLAMLAYANRANGTWPAEALSARRMLAMVHGIALLIAFVAGFGLMARTGVTTSAWPSWIYGKIGVWLFVGVSVAFVRRIPGFGRLWILLLPLLGAVGAWLAITKPQ